jgi:hypothetical protein
MQLANNRPINTEPGVPRDIEWAQSNVELLLYKLHDIHEAHFKRINTHIQREGTRTLDKTQAQTHTHTTSWGV